MEIQNFILLAFIGLLAGFLAGGLGIGGGIIIIPALVFFFGMSQHQAQGTSLAVLSVPVGFILAAINYHKKGFINYKIALIMVLAFLVGSYFGSKLAVELPEKTLKKAFGILVIIAGAKMIFGK